MAYKVYYEEDAFTGSDRRMFYVSHSVGATASNFWTDIMLVQYFIRQIYFANESSGNFNVWNMTAATRADFKDLPDPNKDYKALKKTAKWIKYFQTDAVTANSYSLVVDGRVDVAPCLQYHPNGKLKTIQYLNIVYQNSMSSVGIEDWYSWIMSDPAFPQQVKSQLMADVITVTVTP